MHCRYENYIHRYVSVFCISLYFCPLQKNWMNCASCDRITTHWRDRWMCWRDKTFSAKTGRYERRIACVRKLNIKLRKLDLTSKSAQLSLDCTLLNWCHIILHESGVVLDCQGCLVRCGEMLLTLCWFRLQFCTISMKVNGRKRGYCSSTEQLKNSIP